MEFILITDGQLISFASAKRVVLNKTNTIDDTLGCLKHIIAIICSLDQIWRLRVNLA